MRYSAIMALAILLGQRLASSFAFLRHRRSLYPSLITSRARRQSPVIMMATQGPSDKMTVVQLKDELRSRGLK